MKPGYLTCEYLTNPIGIDETQPRLSWRFDEEENPLKQQSAYHILVSKSQAALQQNMGDVWDSGRVMSGESYLVEYAGAALHSRQRVYWKVRVWDENDISSEWSDVGLWEMGLLKADDWQAKWIGADWVGGPRTSCPVPQLRREICLPSDPNRARLYISALGVFRASINGVRVGEDEFAPGWTNYHKTVHYCTYDVTQLFHEGKNVIGALLGDGWFCGHTSWYHRQMYGDRPRLLAQLEIDTTDGATLRVVSDAQWQVARSAILESDMLMGESIDARLEPPNWDTPEFSDTHWQSAQTFADTGAVRRAFIGEPIRAIETIMPICPPTLRKTHAINIYTFDLGQNFSGRVRLKVHGKLGQTLTLRYGEMLNPDGTLYTANLRSARVVDHFTLKGDGVEVYESVFTFHGFRYVEVSGLEGELLPDVVTGVVLHNAMSQTGQFECSHPLINQLQHNIEWGQRSNYFDVPTDCPQRDERMGWTGDAQMFIRTATFNFNVAPFFTRWLNVMNDEQGENGSIPAVIPNTDPNFVPDGGPAWSDAVVICPFTIYRCYGDVRVLQRQYPTMQGFMRFLANTAENDIRVYPNFNGWHGFGDWLSVNAETPKDLIGTAFYAYCADLMSRIAMALGKTEDAAYYVGVFERVRNAFNRRFVTADGRVGSGSQTSYVLALHFNLLPAHLRKSATDELVYDIKQRGVHLSTGFVGTPYLAHALANNGRRDLAYALLEQTTYPSWLYPVTQGATTMWERWDSWHHERGFGNIGMNSFNHYAYGAIGDWMYQTIAGIVLDETVPGYKQFVLRPQPGGSLTHARAKYCSPFGDIVSDWKIEDGVFKWHIIVPPNTRAKAYLPDLRNDATPMIAHELAAGKHYFEHIV